MARVVPETSVAGIACLRTQKSISCGAGQADERTAYSDGVLLLQQAMDLTDHDAADQLSYNIQWHYALNITEESDSAKYICEKTIWTMRNHITELGLDSVLFDKLTDKLADVFAVNTENQRTDSVHIRSNMRRLGRITIFTQTIIKFLCNLKRQHQDSFNAVDQEL